MKDPSGRTKVVIRQLPPSLSQSDLLTHFEDRFSDRYNWFYFRPGKYSHKHLIYSRAYIDFKSPEDVFEFAEFFDGHVFVNEKGAQFKAIVEYAPSQRILKQCTKSDGREGTIYKDPDYMEFLKLIAKPIENLPSAEIQLERKQAEQAGVTKKTSIVTPLMEFVRQKRAAEGGTQGFSAVGRVSRRARSMSSGKPGSGSTKRGAEKKKYTFKDRAKNMNRKVKSTFTVAPGCEDQPAASSGKALLENNTGSVSRVTLTSDSGKKRILLLKGKEQEISQAPEGILQQQGVTFPVGNPPVSTSKKVNQRREPGGRLIRSILLNNDARQSSIAGQSQQKIQTLGLENDKKPVRPINKRSGSNGHVSNIEPPAFSSGGHAGTPDDKTVKKDLHGLGAFSDKQEKRTRNKDRPDRGVWTLRRSDISNENLLSSASEHTQLLSGSVEDYPGELKVDMSSGSQSGEVTAHASGPKSSVENGSRHVGRRGGAHIVKDGASLNIIEGKFSKRGSTGYGAHEKQVWVQRP